ncbi:hypothetical protein OAS39_11740, partial [Pirellulales bacterium]|nr:hypothetical protein [Pirellulales bacterium]
RATLPAPGVEHRPTEASSAVARIGAVSSWWRTSFHRGKLGGDGHPYSHRSETPTQETAIRQRQAE